MGTLVSAHFIYSDRQTLRLWAFETKMNQMKPFMGCDVFLCSDNHTLEELPPARWRKSAWIIVTWLNCHLATSKHLWISDVWFQWEILYIWPSWMVLHPALPPKTSDSSDESSDLALLTFCLDCERLDDEKSRRIQTFVCLFVFLLCSILKRGTTTESKVTNWDDEPSHWKMVVERLLYSLRW